METQRENSMDNRKCPYCWHELEIGQGDGWHWVLCPYCGLEGPKTGTEQRAWGAWGIVEKSYARFATGNNVGQKMPLPVKRDERGPVSEKSVKELLAKVFEELSELQFAMRGAGIDIDDIDNQSWATSMPNDRETKAVHDEWADTITALTTLAYAIGIYSDERAAAIARCNKRNQDRGRL